jgi:hypothetical protein
LHPGRAPLPLKGINSPEVGFIGFPWGSLPLKGINSPKLNNSPEIKKGGLF